jgi:protocatechuate 4,5-dioxygenase alpha chain
VTINQHADRELIGALVDACPKRNSRGAMNMRLVEYKEPWDAHDIPGTTLFDGTQAMKGYALNHMCWTFNSEANRKEFLRDPEAYFEKYGLNEQQKEAIRTKNVLAMLEAGGNIYYLAKFAGIFGLNVQDIGAQQTGMSVEEFKAKLVAAGK